MFFLGPVDWLLSWLLSWFLSWPAWASLYFADGAVFGKVLLSPFRADLSVNPRTEATPLGQRLLSALAIVWESGFVIR